MLPQSAPHQRQTRSLPFGMNRSPHADHPVLKQLTQVRHALLRLHKALLDVERARYESAHGPVQSPGQLLKLVIENPEFDWLHRLSELVVAIDEAMEDKQTGLTPEGAQAFLDQSRALLTPSATGSAFAQKYARLIQNPSITPLHAELSNLLREK